MRATKIIGTFLAVLVVAGAAQAQQGAPRKEPAAAPPAPVTESQARARAILMKMAQHLAQAPRYSVSLRAAYDAVQESGQKIEFAESRKITLSRPDRFRIDGEQSDGDKVAVVFSGKEITLLDLGAKVYATAMQPGGLDETVVHFVRDLGMRLPLAALLLTRLPKELEERIRVVDYVEKTSYYGAPAHHIAARTDTVDFQVWVTDGDKPLPQRIVLTYKEASGQPQFWAQFSDWNFAPTITDATFKVTVPKGTQKIAFAAQLQKRASAMGKPATADKGGK